jgi:hypothetical protein
MSLNASNQFSTVGLDFQIRSSRLDNVLSNWYIGLGFLTVSVALFFGIKGLLSLIFNPKIKSEESDILKDNKNQRKTKMSSDQSKEYSFVKTEYFAHRNLLENNSTIEANIDSDSFASAKKENSFTFQENARDLNEESAVTKEDSNIKKRINYSMTDEGSLVSSTILIL